MSDTTSDTTNPIGLLAELILAARQQKALFDAYVEAGFTEQQALYLTGAAVGGAR